MVAHARRRYLRVVIPCAAVLIARLLAWLLYQPAALYRVTILPSLGGWHTRAYALNDRGQVVGVENMGNDNERLFLWDRENGIQDLGPVTGDPLAINNAGQISGTMPVDPNSLQAFLWEPARGRTMLDPVGSKLSVALAMNNRGQIIGISRNPALSSPFFLWDKATGMKALSTPDGSRCEPVSINDAGQVLVVTLPGSANPRCWYLLDPNGPISLDTVGPRTWPHSINNRSCMAGIDEFNTKKPYLIFWDEQKKPRRLTPVNTNDMTRLNDRNQIAYTDFVRSRWEDWRERFFRPRLDAEEAVSYLWDPARGRVPLNRYVRGMKRFLVADLNNNGCIVGTAEMKDGSTRSVLLEPILERWGSR